MSDKVQLIKEEIEKQKSFYQRTFDVLHPDDLDATIAYTQIELLDRLLQFIDSLPEENHFEDKSEMVSEDLKEAALKYRWEHPFCDGYTAYSFKAGAEWQKQKDQETIELAEDHAMLAGMNRMKEEMMENAVETTIVNDWQYGKDPDHAIIPAIHQRIKGFNVGDKVKIIIVKEEQ